MNACFWEEIHGFETPGEYRRFCCWLDSQIEAGMVEEIPVPRSEFMYGEKWFRCKRSNEIWRRFDPDPPSRGGWEPVRNKPFYVNFFYVGFYAKIFNILHKFMRIFYN